jgi:hypothetical protein
MGLEGVGSRGRDVEEEGKSRKVRWGMMNAEQDGQEDGAEVVSMEASNL